MWRHGTPGGRWVAASGDGCGEPVLLRRDVGATYDGRSGGVVRRYHRAGGIVTRRRRRPSPFPFSLPVARTNTRTRFSDSLARVPFQSTRTYTHTRKRRVCARRRLARLSHPSVSYRSADNSFIAVAALIFDRNKNLNIIIIVVVNYYYNHHRHSCCYY